MPCFLGFCALLSELPADSRLTFQLKLFPKEVDPCFLGALACFFFVCITLQFETGSFLSIYSIRKCVVSVFLLELYNRRRLALQEEHCYGSARV